MNNLTRVSDIFFVVGVVLVAMGAFGIISSKGGFTGLSYFWYWVTDGLTRKNVMEPRKDYYTYQKDFLEKKKKNQGLLYKTRVVALIAGMLCIMVSLIIALCLC